MMKNLYKFLAMTAVVIASSAHAATMQFDMAAYDLDVSAGTFDVTLSVSGLVAGTQGGSEVITAFNDSVLSVDNVVFGADTTGGLFAPTFDVSVAGSLVLDHPAFILGGLPADSVVATITFNILATGTSDLVLVSPNSENPWSYSADVTGDGIPDTVPYCITDIMPPGGTCELLLPGDNGEIVQVEAMTLTGSSVNISAIPVPPAVWLFGSGLLGLVSIARRKTSPCS